ncbi:MAG: hypothetical protein R1F52_06390 [Candidatus Nitrosoabyssus spongiisocia]|nr:MAG: hypothetical protein R1F52_06390 [Nitrosopumilaceae archaeon AB1(1)]
MSDSIKQTVVKKHTINNGLEIIPLADSSATIQSIVFRTCSIKPNPFITKKPDATNRL